MDLHQLQCFVAVAEELHFGRAARRMDLMPAAFGRHVRLLEDSLGTRLLDRTTRSVALTEDGEALLAEARILIASVDAFTRRVRDQARSKATTLRLGAVDTAAAGLVPMLLQDFRSRWPDIAVELVEDKSIGLIPRLLSGRLDLALIRPPSPVPARIEVRHLLHESAIVAVQRGHRLAGRRSVTVRDLAGEPLIVPDRRSRPHSHGLTTELFARAGLRPSIAQVAGEKQTIVGLVAAGLGVALVPRWTARLNVAGVVYLDLRPEETEALEVLPLAAAWIGGSRDPLRDDMLDLLAAKLARYRAEA